MTSFRVQCPELGGVDVEAESWLEALGVALRGFGALGVLERLACERLSNGVWIARDVRRGMGFIVTPADAPELEPAEAGEHTEELPFPAADDETSFPEELGNHMMAITRAPRAFDAVHLALDGLLKLVAAEGGAVLVVDGDLLRFAVARGPSARRLEGMTLPITQGFAGHALAKGSMLVVTNPYGDARFHRDIDRATGHHTRNMLVVPVLHQRQPLAVVEVVNALAPAGFRASDMQHAASIAESLAERLARGDR